MKLKRRMQQSANKIQMKNKMAENKKKNKHLQLTREILQKPEIPTHNSQLTEKCLLSLKCVFYVLLHATNTVSISADYFPPL